MGRDDVIEASSAMKEKYQRKSKPFFNQRTKKMVWPGSPKPNKEKGKVVMSDDKADKQDLSIKKPDSIDAASRFFPKKRWIRQSYPDPNAGELKR